MDFAVFCCSVLAATVCFGSQALADEQDGVGPAERVGLSLHVEPDELVVSETKLKPAPDGLGGPGDQVGRSVSVSGNRVAVGAPGLGSSGGVIVYEFDGQNWVEQATLQSSGESEYFNACPGITELIRN